MLKPMYDDALFHPLHAPQLPDLTLGRWSPRHKQSVVHAVLDGYIALPQMIERYNVSIDEFLAWQRRYQE
jgi:Protein of unknown function (DUF1153)